MSGLALRLLDQLVPRGLAAQMLGCRASTFSGIPTTKLTLRTAFLAALDAARADLAAAREKRRNARAVRKAKVLRIAQGDAIAALRFADLVRADLEQAAHRLASVDPVAALRVRQIAAKLYLQHEHHEGTTSQ
ncbi:hypothetical protein G5B31_20675 [Rhodobacter sp. SGA-6-6]|uniref:hypothetical protein n=1 Tax=Rhodobacter sp. SGA-6-6 TaxID=2710882 RepID=UPI0013EA3D7D|nr:hypothetical protein [Rhodobacter sp. SGA-6-6]NGM47936.1 hypothetical protein [Rhodobacter sp. SGA-6-6]